MDLISGSEGLFTYRITWMAQGDACPQCRNLNGRVYEHQNIFDVGLYDMQYGLVYNFTTNRPTTHPNCRCGLDVEVNLDYFKIPEFNELFKRPGWNLRW